MVPLCAAMKPARAHFFLPSQHIVYGPFVPLRASHVRARATNEGQKEDEDPMDKAKRTMANLGIGWTVAFGVILGYTVVYSGTHQIQKVVNEPSEDALTGQCVIAQCQKELAACLADRECVENLACLRQCSGPDKAECQVKCGDLYQSAAIENFNTCAVSEKKCVGRRVEDPNKFPIPPSSSLDHTFDVKNFTGTWYIVAGLNPIFDCFDCQVHKFTAPTDTTLQGDLSWRVKRPNGQFYTRSAIQNFVQTEDEKGILLNHDETNVLHYKDDWYILYSNEAKDVVVVYYKGTNDAWDGYGGAVVYSTKPKLDPAEIPAISKAVEGVPGLTWSQFAQTDNTCGPEPALKVVAPSDLDTLGDDVEAVEEIVADDVKKVGQEVVKDVESVMKEAEKDLISFGKGFTWLRSLPE